MAGGDVKLRLAPGQEMPVTTPGDYIFLKFADRDIRVTITEGQGVQKPVVMRAGDKYRPGPFRALNIQNTDTTKPAQIIMVIGEGDFNRQVVQGEISIVPGIRRADGTWSDDRRFDISAFLMPKKSGTVELRDGDTLKTLVWPETTLKWETMTVDRDGFLKCVLTMNNPNAQKVGVLTVDRDLNSTLELREKPAEFLNDVFYYEGDLYHYETNWNETLRRVRKNGDVLFESPIKINANLGFADGLIYSQRATKTAESQIVALDMQGNIVKDIPASKLQPAGLVDVGINNLIFEPFGRTWTLTRGNSFTFFVFDEDFNFLYSRNGQQGIGVSSSSDPKTVAIGDVVYAIPSPGVNTLWKAQLVDRTKTLSGQAFKADCFSAMVRRDWANRETSAEVSVVQSDGQTTIRGEVIKAAIELYYGAELKPGFDYLDHVYGVKVERPAGPGLTDQATSKATTFKAAKIEDKFAALLPSKIQLTIDDGLKFRNPMEY